MDKSSSTLDFYARNAEEFAAKSYADSFFAHRELFSSKLAAGSRVLELGSGSGEDALALLAQGFDVTAVDGSAELAAIAARRIKREVLVIKFEDLAFVEEFDGVWAAASLLHVPFDQLGSVVQRVAQSLRPGGVLVASFKESEVDWTDCFGRYFCAMTKASLADLIKTNGFELETIDAVPGKGSDGKPTTWLWVTAFKI
ncbi:class I SAM-dependent methyltransferase [Kiloniella sp.]|uniref:class I SAM-dependent methyltransferase n=1 Tax=Kiloniella sp. TaxID=1938587 RepID=UPI003B016ABE